MKFRPCIDLHCGVVKQIVGSTLADDSESSATIANPVENFVASDSAASFADRYRRDGLFGGHIIMLGQNCESAAEEALVSFPGGMHVGGGINLENAIRYLEKGASHVIVTSFIFEQGEIDFNKLSSISNLVGKTRLVIDLSCRKRVTDIDTNESKYYVVTNKWTKYTNYPITIENLLQLSSYCDEFLVHGVDVEGKRAGIEEELVQLLGEFGNTFNIPITYAGGIRSIDDLELVKRIGCDKVDCTVGSALDIFGGELSYDDVLRWHNEQLTANS
eukprot:gene7255-9892_t